MTDIVEKLRDACIIDRHYGKSVTLTLDYDDYMEAAAEIERLRAGGCARDQGTTQYCAEAAKLAAENEKLRAALKELLACPHVADRDIDPAWIEPETEAAVEAARVALEGRT